MLQTNKNEIIIIESKSGVQISKQIINDVCIIESHPTDPLIVIATRTGIVMIFEIDETAALKCFAEFFLTQTEIFKLCFTQDYLIVFDGDYDLFLIQKSSQNVKKFISDYPEFIDISANEIDNLIFILNLFTKNGEQTPKSYLMCTAINLEFVHTKMTVPLNELYSSMHLQLIDRKMHIFAAKMKRNEIDIFQMEIKENGSFVVTLFQTIQTPHSTGNIKFNGHLTNFISYGSDGRITFWESMKTVRTFIAHNEHSRGTKFATFNAAQRHASVSIRIRNHLKLFLFSDFWFPLARVETTYASNQLNDYGLIFCLPIMSKEPQNIGLETSIVQDHGSPMN